MKKLFSVALITVLFLLITSFAQAEGAFRTPKNDPALLSFLSLDRVKDAKKIEEFVEEYKGKNIELYMLTSYIDQYRNYKTRFIYVLTATYGKDLKLSGPAFAFKDVGYYDLKLTGPNVPDSFDLGLWCKVRAEVEGMEGGLVLLDPISIEVVSKDDAIKQSTIKPAKSRKRASNNRNVSGFKTKTNQKVAWCGLDFSFPSYFDKSEVTETDIWVNFYPEKKEYYATLMFQSFDLVESQNHFVSALPNIIESTFYSGEHIAVDEISQSEPIVIAGLPGWTVKCITSEDENGNFSDMLYTIAFNHEAEKVFIISCIVDNTDKSKYDYFGDYKKMLDAAKLADKPSENRKDNLISTEPKYDFAYARKFSEYTIYMLFDIEGKIVRNFTTNDTSVMVGKIEGDLSKGISIHYNYDGGWDETFKLKNKNQKTGVLIDNDGFDWNFEQVSVEEVEIILNTGGYKDMEFN
ncbi:MAG: DUF4839 domain-containing protein [Christensenellales bacterium]